MKYYHKEEDRIIEDTEMVARYGTDQALPIIGIFELSVQPNYIPVSYNELPNGTYYPVQSYNEVKTHAIAALVEAGYSQAEAESRIG
jgi:hypothetical protein